MADDGQTEDTDQGWTVRLEEVQRIVPMDPEDVDAGDLFAVSFEASAPDMDASVEVLVSDVADEAQAVIEALDALRDGLGRWARVLARRPGAGCVEPREG